MAPKTAFGFYGHFACQNSVRTVTVRAGRCIIVPAFKDSFVNAVIEALFMLPMALSACFSYFILGNRFCIMSSSMAAFASLFFLRVYACPVCLNVPARVAFKTGIGLFFRKFFCRFYFVL